MTEAQKRATRAYKSKMAQLTMYMPPEDKELIQVKAERLNLSMVKLVIEAVKKYN